ncbi:hypothetical protein ACLB2K_037370 [Fragaria x ananassa]
MLPRLVSSQGEKSEEIFRAKIDDLSDVLLVEILCRLPCNKLIFQCKLVSKSWYNLISDPYFVRRYLCLQRQMQKPVLKTLVFFEITKPVSLITTSDHPVFKAAASNFTLGFLPCYSQAKDIEELVKGSYPLKRHLMEEPGSVEPPIVVGSYNDFVLCCATKYYQRHYYLCNPYTKQWVPLPPTPQVSRDAPVAFVCDPYYYYDGGEEERRTSSTTNITLNAEYKWKAVRLVPNSSDPNFHFEIFSSETRQWREIHVACSRPFSSFAILDSGTFPITSSSVAYKGLIYWWSDNGLVLELDLSKSDTNAMYRFIEAPEDYHKIHGACDLGMLGVSQGRLRFCIHRDYLSPWDHDEGLQSFRVRELKQVVEDSQGRLKWLTDRVSIDCKDVDIAIPNTTKVLAFHPNNDDVVYMSDGNKIVTCNLRGGRLEKTAATRVKGISRDFYYPFSLPWWPTPVPKTLE